MRRAFGQVQRIDNIKLVVVLRQRVFGSVPAMAGLDRLASTGERAAGLLFFNVIGKFAQSLSKKVIENFFGNLIIPL